MFLLPHLVLLVLREKGQALGCFQLRDPPNGPSAPASEPSSLMVGKGDSRNECFVGFVWGEKSPNPCGFLGKGLGRGPLKVHD